MDKPQRRIPQNFIRELVARTDIVALIQARVKLKKAGTNYQALCPFHTEKTPSFSVSPTKQYYHCFGCGAHGNAIDFLMNYDRMHFVDTIESLAAHAGMPIPTTEEKTEQSKQYLALHDLLKDIAATYQANLSKHPTARAYLDHRGLKSATIEQFTLGFAPKGWDHLLKRFGNSAERIKQLRDTGMLAEKSDSNGQRSKRYYDRFRERIMFPIRDYRGRVVGFGGRTMGDDVPKYLNSPETSLFQKSTILYGLFEAKQANRKLEKLFVVEGYMDVIALAEHGIPYAVATLGTALSASHVQQLFRHAPTIIFCFDGDEAGNKAAWRALEMTLPFMCDGIDAKFMFIPDGKDPDDLVRQLGKSGFLEASEKAQSLPNFFFDVLGEDINISTIAGQSRLAKRAMSLIDKMPTGIFKALMLEKLAEHLEMDEKKLRSLLAEIPTPPSYTDRPIQTLNKKAALKLSPEQLAIALLAQHPQLAKEIPHKHKEEETSDTHQKKNQEIVLLSHMIKALRASPEMNTAMLIEHFRNSNMLKLLQSLAIYPHILPETSFKDELLGALNKVKLKLLEENIQYLLNKAQTQALNTEEKQQLQGLIRKKTGLPTS